MVVLNVSATNLLANTTVPSITLVVTSCGRAALLHKTLETFSQNNTHPLYEAVIVEDGGLEHDHASLAQVLNLAPEKLRIIKNLQNIGQLRSIDRAYASVKSEYIFHCEDDWEFYRPGFIEESLDILCTDARLFCVWIRAHDDTNGHPIDCNVKLTANGHDYYLMALGYRGVWNGFTLNPGLRRTADCLITGPYSELPIAHELKGRTKITESDLSIHYHRLGYRAAISSGVNGYIRHIGQNHHLANEWESKLLVLVKNYGRRAIEVIRGCLRGV